MKKLKAFGLFLAFIAACFVLALATHSFVNHYLNNTPANAAVSCDTTGTNHLVAIKDSNASPVATNAKLCDTLTIKNTDDQVRLMAFGEHDHHEPYDGITEKALDKNQSLTVTLNQAGTFKFHDHLDDSAQGTFTVSQ